MVTCHLSWFLQDFRSLLVFGREHGNDPSKHSPSGSCLRFPLRTNTAGTWTLEELVFWRKQKLSFESGSVVQWEILF